MITVSQMRLSLDGLPDDWLIGQDAVGNVVLVDPKTKAWVAYFCLANGELEIFTKDEATSALPGHNR